MDKLKQVLKFQFWILLAVALILPLVGWTMATSGLVTEAEARTKELGGLRDSLKTDSNDPNKDWEAGGDLINRQQAEQPKDAHKKLYERQLPLMTWPSQMHNDPEKISTNDQEFYRTFYVKLVEQVRTIVKPIDEETPAGLVEYSEASLPRPDRMEWESQAPSVKQIVAAQEDLWLLASILKQIAAVNDDWEAKTQFEAPIRQITELYLRGGSSKSGGGSKSSTGSGGGSAGTGAAGMKAGMESKFSQMGQGLGNASAMMGQNAGGGSTSITNPKINPDDDLGPEQAAPAEKSGDSKSSSSSSSAVAGGTRGMESKFMTQLSGPGPGAGIGGGGMGSSARWSDSKMGRYRDDKPEFKTRGFYLEVVMDHRRIPELLTSLANAEWPITVLRVQESDFKDEDLADAGSDGAGLPGMGSSRSMGMGGMRMGSGGMGPGMGGTGIGMARAPSRPRPDDDDSGGRPINSSMNDSSNNRSPLEDPNLSNVAIVGLIYIFKKPDEKPAAGSPASPARTSPVVAAPAARAPGATAADPSKAPPAAAGVESETAAAEDAAAAEPGPAAAGPESDSESKPETKSENNPEEAGPTKDGAPRESAPGPGKS